MCRRVARGASDTPEAKVRQCDRRSCENVIPLLPVLDALRVFDSSTEADTDAGIAPTPRLLLDCYSTAGVTASWCRQCCVRCSRQPRCGPGRWPRPRSSSTWGGRQNPKPRRSRVAEAPKQRVGIELHLADEGGRELEVRHSRGPVPAQCRLHRNTAQQATRYLLDNEAKDFPAAAEMLLIERLLGGDDERLFVVFML
jgi:hypothetical protein